MYRQTRNVGILKRTQKKEIKKVVDRLDKNGLCWVRGGENVKQSGELAIQRIIDQMSFSSSVNGINTAGKV